MNISKILSKNKKEIKKVGTTGAVFGGMGGWLGAGMGLSGSFGGISAAWLLAPVGVIIGTLTAIIYIIIKKR